MSLTYPTYEELSAQITAVFRTQLPSIDPTVFGSWAMAFANGNAALAQSISYLVRDLEKQLFPQTATDEFLDQWGYYEALTRLQAASAFGNITMEGTVGTVIPVLTDFRGGNGIVYQSQAVATIQTVLLNIPTVGLTSVGTTATVVFGGDHYLATGTSVTIAGATQTEYNVTAVISVTARDTFQYTFAGSGTSPATTGTVITCTSVTASIEVKAVTTGIETNLPSGSQLTLETSIPGAADISLVQFDGLSGGTVEETDESYRARILLSRSIREGVFTPDQIILAGLSYAGNTRVWVKKPTVGAAGIAVDVDTPAPGECSVYVLRDDDPNITPSQGILDATKAVIVADGSLPANMSEASLYVGAPVIGPAGVPTPFTFLTLVPDTPTMRTAVEDTLAAFFADTVDFEVDITEASYLGAIQNTQDLETGALITSFSLSAPTGNITISDGEIGALGAVTWF